MKHFLTAVVFVFLLVMPALPKSFSFSENTPLETNYSQFNESGSFVITEEKPLNFSSSSFYPNSMDTNIDRQYIIINNNYQDGMLFAAAKTAANTAKKKETAKSESTNIENTFSIDVKPAFLLPLGDWKKLIKAGYGGMLELSYNNLFFNGFKIGIESGYINAKGKDDSVKKEYIVPVLATLGWKIPVVGGLGIIPVVSAGEGYFNLTYTPKYGSSKTKGAFEFLAKGGLSIVYDIGNTISIKAGSEYGTIFEKDGRLTFVLFELGLGINF